MSLSARASAIAATARAQQTDELAALRAANPEFVAWLDSFRATFDAKLTYLRDYGTGREWGVK